MIRKFLFVLIAFACSFANAKTYNVGESVPVEVTTRNLTTGAAQDADAPPTYRVYEDGVFMTGQAGSMTLTDDANTTGFYTVVLTASSGNGYEVGKTYQVVITATVGGTTDSITKTFQIGGYTRVIDGTGAGMIDTDAGEVSLTLAAEESLLNNDITNNTTNNTLGWYIDHIDDTVISAASSSSTAATRVTLALPAIAPNTAGGLLTLGTGAGQLTTSSGQVTVGTNNDKTGYALSAAGVTAVQSGLATAASITSLQTTLQTDIGNVPTAAETATAVRTELTAELAFLDVAVSTRLPTASYTAPPTANDNASALLGSTVASFNVAGSVGELMNWLKATFAASGVFDTESLANAPAGGGGGSSGGGISFTAYVGSLDPNAESYDIIQGEEKLITVIVQARGTFADSTPTAITIKLKDQEGNVVTIPNADITRVLEDSSFQVVRFTLDAADSATLSSGYVTMEVAFDNERVQLFDHIRILVAL